MAYIKKSQNGCKPHIIKAIPSKIIRQKRVFRLSIRKYFGPKQSNLQYALIGQVPTWLFIDAQLGIISGIAPKVSQNKQFLVTVQAHNIDGKVSQSFFIKVINTDFFEVITEGLIHNLSLKKQFYRFDLDNIPKRHDLLELIFEFIINSDHKDLAIKKVNDKAKDLNIKTEKTFNYENFKEIVLKIQPNIEASLAASLTEKHIATLAEINNIEFRNLFRQGSQQPGSIVPYVLNELGIVNFTNMSHHPIHGKNILDAAADRLIKLRHQNEKSNMKKFNP